MSLRHHLHGIDIDHGLIVKVAADFWPALWPYLIVHCCIRRRMKWSTPNPVSFLFSKPTVALINLRSQSSHFTCLYKFGRLLCQLFLKTKDIEKGEKKWWLWWSNWPSTAKKDYSSTHFHSLTHPLEAQVAINAMNNNQDEDVRLNRIKNVIETEGTILDFPKKGVVFR